MRALRIRQDLSERLPTREKREVGEAVREATAQGV